MRRDKDSNVIWDADEDAEIEKGAEARHRAYVKNALWEETRKKTKVPDDGDDEDRERKRKDRKHSSSLL